MEFIVTFITGGCQVSVHLALIPESEDTKVLGMTRVGLNIHSNSFLLRVYDTSSLPKKKFPLIQAAELVDET